MSVSVTVVLVLFLLLFAVSSSRGEERTDVISYDVRFQHKLDLQNASRMQSTLVKDAMGCYTSCVNARWCKSGNFKTAPERNGLHVCEVLPSDEFNKNNNLTKDVAYRHFRIKTPCEIFHKKTCLNGGECIKKDQKHQCKCAPGFEREECEQAVNRVKNCKGHEMNETEVFLNGSAVEKKNVCRVVIATISSPSVRYRIDVDIYSDRTPPGSKQMHPGIGLNVQDVDNMDVVYFMPHVPLANGVQSWKMVDGKGTRTQSSCFFPSTPPAYKWYHVTIEVTASYVKVLCDGVYGAGFVPFFPLTKRGAVIVLNGYPNSVIFRDFQIASL